jgi:ABC-type lipoprotein export system ATPase subunit
MGILKCEHVIKKFSNGKVIAVNDVSLDFEEGVHIIMGKSGCGKSTLLHILGSLEKPDLGKVIYDGIDLYKDVEIEDIRQNHFGFVFQSYNLIPEINVRDNILMPAYIAKRNEKSRFDDLVSKLEITKQLKQMPETLSGGEQQRVAIARALINNPKIIFADEPTGNLDEYNKDNVIKLLIDTCRDFNALLIMVTHDPDQLKYADYHYHMTDGKIDG